jgi:hypothetical protein
MTEATTAKTVTFGKMEAFDTDGAAECTIFVDGESVGSIEKQMIDVGGSSREMVADGYGVDLDNGASTTFFSVRRYRRGMAGRGVSGTYPTARKALAAAKAFARGAAS